MNIAELLADPKYMLHQIIPERNEALFVPADLALLRQLSFLDGRADFSSGPTVTVALDAMLTERLRQPGPDRYIFHVAFCGSTLLARLLDKQGSTLLLKEPNILVDLANWKRSGRDSRFAPALDLSLACLRRSWATGEAVVIKPSNWINNLLPDIVEHSAQLRSIFITMAPDAYVIAVLRGGRDRLAFAARTASHLAPSCPKGNIWLREAIAATADPIGRALNLALVALHLQEMLFSGHAGSVINAEEIFANPVEAARHASDALSLDIDEATIAATVSERKATNAKAPDRSFSLTERRLEDIEIERYHGAAIKAALDWSARTLV